MKTISIPVYTSEARTATPTAQQVVAGDYEGVHVIIDVTAASATPSVTPTIDAYDDLSASWYNLLTGAAITGTGTTVLRIGPDIVDEANLQANDYLPDDIRVTMTHGDTDSITYTVNCRLFRKRYG